VAGEQLLHRLYRRIAEPCHLNSVLDMPLMRQADDLAPEPSPGTGLVTERTVDRLQRMARLPDIQPANDPPQRNRVPQDYSLESREVAETEE